MVQNMQGKRLRYQAYSVEEASSMLGTFGWTELLIVFPLYFLPAFIAIARRNTGRKQVLRVFLVNLLLGWTIAGWIVALVMSFDRG